MANTKRKKTDQSLIPPNPVAQERAAFKKAVRRSSTSGTAPMDDVLFDEESGTASAAKRLNKLATGVTASPAETTQPIKPPDLPKKEESISVGIKITATILGLSGAIIGLVYFFSQINSKAAENATNISNLEKNQQSLKKDLNESIEKVESRMNDRFEKLETRMESIPRSKN